MPFNDIQKIRIIIHVVNGSSKNQIETKKHSYDIIERIIDN